jgi:hypothetical protein
MRQRGRHKYLGKFNGRAQRTLSKLGLKKEDCTKQFQKLDEEEKAKDKNPGKERS